MSRIPYGILTIGLKAGVKGRYATGEKCDVMELIGDVLHQTSDRNSV